GHGKEAYFWGLIVAILLFGMGGGLSLYEGVKHVRDPTPVAEGVLPYVVLAVAAAFEGTSFVVALRQLSRAAGGQSLWRALRSSKDPSVFVVVAEDAAALLGIGIALLGVFLSQRLHAPVLDGVASLLIRVLLTAVALLLAHES